MNEWMMKEGIMSRTMSFIRRIAVCTMCLCLLSVFGGCGGQQDAKRSSSAKDSWSSTLRQKAEESGVDPYVASVFKDGKISDAELNDVSERMSQCLAKQNITFKRNVDGSAKMLNDSSMDNAVVQQHISECGDSTGYDMIDMYYQEIRSNPQHLSDAEFRKAIFACLKRADIINKKMAYEEFDDLFTDNIGKKSQGDNSETAWDKQFKQYEDASDPRYTDSNGAKWQACMTDPTHN
ncbi:hypothetical protein EMB92_07105 [Bifidobacterium callitrichos]|uniref:Uncharacterized protein n=1 Tax=Bifidobacterium callitrichos TaxID=762209 RepID=A0A5M9ZDB3_9BIFI|nr:hypothetical protein [Bifidobacterium callitrichos]KAA8816631.1 hypothetical protein EMB92_07105 [Bifidobacterium callitrichos]